MAPHPNAAPRSSGSLVDILDRVLDKGLVVAGDIRVSLADVELLTIRIRLLVCSIDKAEEIGLDWWKGDPELSNGMRMLTVENEDLRERIRLLEDRLGTLALDAAQSNPPAREPARAPRKARRTRK